MAICQVKNGFYGDKLYRYPMKISDYRFVCSTHKIIPETVLTSNRHNNSNSVTSTSYTPPVTLKTQIFRVIFCPVSYALLYAPKSGHKKAGESPRRGELMLYSSPLIK